MIEAINPQLLSWASLLEEKAREQAIATSQLPFIAGHIALMPDAHWGMGSTIGSVIPTEDVVMPAAVGVDIGCGMAAVGTQLTRDDVEKRGDLRELRLAIQERVPVSPGKYRTELSSTVHERIEGLERQAKSDGVNPEKYSGNWRHQLGSLGGGNHFLELCYDEEDRVWVFLHSGSRGVGNKIAQHHVKIAKTLCKQWHVPLPHPDLSFLPEGDPRFWEYVRDLRWAQAFALENRSEMLDQMVDALRSWIGGRVLPMEVILCHHNYTERERHMGRDVWLTRKGAINAEPGKLGLIPGSMGTRSYVVEGLGNQAAFNSAPHGAGRNFSRRAAREKFSVAELEKAMDGIEWRAEDAEKFLDEIPGAYKPVEQVMADAADLVKVRHTLRQFLNVKGE